MSLKEQIAAAQDLPSKLKTVEEWGGLKLLLRALEAKDFVWFIRTSGMVPGGGNVELFDFALDHAAELVQRGSWDPENPTVRVFAPEDIDGILLHKSFEVLQELAMEISSLTIPSEGEVSAEKKDSSTDPTSASATS